MTGIAKLSLAMVATGFGVLGLLHAGRALHASRPADMPADAQFLSSGYDIEHNEAQGAWVACRVDALEATDWCRMTDQNGQVVFQGAYLPVGSANALPSDRLRVAVINPQKLWVQSPAHQVPEPVLPLASGGMLVPAEDEYALEQRWRADPREYRGVMKAAGQ